MLKKNWKKLLPLLSIALVSVAGYFLYGIIKNVDWDEVMTYLQSLSTPILAILLGLTASIYFILSLYDYISFKTLLKNKAPPLKIVSPSAMICYAFNFNLGAIIGGLGFRMRIYSGWGIDPKIIPLAALLSVVTTWVGYAFVFSMNFLFGSMPKQADDLLPSFAPWAFGALGIFLVLGYLMASAKEANFKIKSALLIIPKLKSAFIQIFISSLQWTLAASVLYLLLDHFGAVVPWQHVLFTYLLASIGGVIARIPAGVGVIEAIFLKTLPETPASTMLAALLCFRALYFLAPLLISIVGYIAIEYMQKRSKDTDTFLPSRNKDHYAR